MGEARINTSAGSPVHSELHTGAVDNWSQLPTASADGRKGDASLLLDEDKAAELEMQSRLKDFL